MTNATRNTQHAWRLLQTPPAPGAWNMAVDEAILQAVAAGQSPPTLRFFAWRPACLSLGYFQPIEDADADACARRGVDLVRRPTGGSAILHDNELTYSVTALESNPLVSGDIVAAYRKIAWALALGLQRMGAPIELANSPQRHGDGERGRWGEGERRSENPQSAIRNPQSTIRPVPCFVRPSDYEILAQSKKLVGSAQVRRNGALLQHGALPLNGDVAAIVDLLCLPEAEQQATRDNLRQKATTLATVLGHPADFGQAAEALAQGFSLAWGIRLEPGALSAGEAAAAQTLLLTRYTTSSWTTRR